MKYPVVFEQACDGGWGAYAPDLPGLGVVGKTREEARELIRQGLALHIKALREDGLPVPQPFSDSELVEVAEVA
jgi:predicted RNase H-like HicB family nuclease